MTLVQDFVRSEAASCFNRCTGIAVHQSLHFGINLIEAMLNFPLVDDFLLLLSNVAADKL